MYSVQGDAVDQADWKEMPSLWGSPASRWWEKLTNINPGLRQWSENGNIHSWQGLPQVWRHWSAPNKTQFLDALSTRKQVLSLWALWGEVFLCAWASFDQLAIWGGCLAPPHDHNPTSMFDEWPRYPGSFSFTHQSPLPSPCQHTEVVLFVTI